MQRRVLILAALVLGVSPEAQAQRPDLVTRLKRLLADWEADVGPGGRI